MNDYHINSAGLQITEESEGLRLKAYLDSGGVPTIGYGHTRGVKLGMACTPQQAKEWLKEDMGIAEDSVKSLVKVPLTENQFSALSDFEFNLGKLGKSTLLKKLNAKDYQGAANEFDKWIYTKGKVLQGLVIRRKKEKDLFTKEQL